MISTIQSIITAECYTNSYHLATREVEYDVFIKAEKIKRTKEMLREWKAKIKLYPLAK